MPDDRPSPPPEKPTGPTGQLKFRDDIVPKLEKKEDQLIDADVEDPLKWDTPDGTKTVPGGRWAAVTGAIAICSLIIVVVFALTRRDPGAETSEEEAPSEQTPPAMFRPDKRQQAWDTISGFLAAETVEEKLAHVAWPEKVADRMRDYYERYPDEPTELIGFQFLSSSPSFETEKNYLLAISAEEGDSRLWVLLDEGGALRTDWECLVAYSPMSIAAFIDSPPTEAMDMRVTAQPSDYYNYEFVDNTKYRAFELHELADQEQTLHGYAEIGSEAHRELEKLVVNANPIPLQLKLSPPSKPGRAVCKIERVVKPHWSGE